MSEKETYYWGRIQKISHLKETALAKSLQDIQPGFFEEGTFRELPQIGERFLLYSDSHTLGGLHTTAIHSVMTVEDIEGSDKLVLPSDFPSPETLFIPQGMKAGDTLFATRNSLYWLSSVKKLEREKKIPASLGGGVIDC